MLPSGEERYWIIDDTGFPKKIPSTEKGFTLSLNLRDAWLRAFIISANPFRPGLKGFKAVLNVCCADLNGLMPDSKRFISGLNFFKAGLKRFNAEPDK